MKVSVARVSRVLIYVCVKCDHASALRRLDGRSKVKGTGHALNARVLGTPLGSDFWRDESEKCSACSNGRREM